MKSKVIIVAVLFFFAALIVFAAFNSLSCNNRNASEYITPNEGIVGFKDFYVTSNSTSLNTSARGTIYIEKDDSNNYTAQIVTWVETDPLDWGGVSFYLPPGWQVTDITSSYPNASNYSIGILEGYVSIESTDTSQLQQIVEIGNEMHSSSVPADGGSGSVIIKLATYPKGQKPSGAFNITVGVGSEVTQEGTQVLNPDFERLEIPIIQDEQ